ncbi:sensor histidine kinase [Winogradskya humida]|nr:histidine kinase [Actinoplanes humidus]
MSATPRPVSPLEFIPMAGAATMVLAGFTCAVGGSGPFAVAMLASVAVLTTAMAVWAVWQVRRNRLNYEARLTAWAATEATLAERLRIAHDLHDIVSHGLGLITVRAAATRHLARGGPGDDGEMRAALADIEDAARQSTAELRRMLAVLRTPDDMGPLLPLETLDRVPDMVAGAEVAGLRTQLEMETAGTVSPGVQVAVCKTVREALSNAARHAGPTDVDIRIAHDAGAVLVTIQDHGPGDAWKPAPGAGHGLTALRERIIGLGGSFTAGPAGHGFRLVARIPDEVVR